MNVRYSRTRAVGAVHTACTKLNDQDHQALAHGINLVGHVDLTQADMEQNIVEYLEDMYLEDWDPGGR